MGSNNYKICNIQMPYVCHMPSALQNGCFRTISLTLHYIINKFVTCLVTILVNNCTHKNYIHFFSSP